MSFTSLAFFLFFLCVFAGRYLLPDRMQNSFLLAANYVFYLWWRPSFALLLLLGTLLSYFAARAVEADFAGRRKLWLVFDLLYTLGLLFAFKYLDFFCAALSLLPGLPALPRFGLLLPVGISFYSFVICAYVIDVYRRKIPAERNFIRYAALVSFFPALLAGPINRAGDLLPQFQLPRAFDGERVKRGLLRFVWGAAKKLILADALGLFVNAVYAAPYDHSGITWLAAAVAYSLQIYFDFSAYTDMALGSAAMLGFRLTENFRAPYLSRTVKDFWKKWHMSLTGWFRDYLYFPLGGSRKSNARTYLNVLIVFAVSGLWHGAAFTFLVWGLLNGLYQVAGQITAPLRGRLRRALRLGEENRVLIVVQGTITFLLITAAWIFFRADTLDQAVYIIKHILLIAVKGPGTFALTQILSPRRLVPPLLLFFLCVGEDIRIAKGKPLPALEQKSFRYWAAIAALTLSVLLFGIYGAGFNAQDFVYFKF